MEKKLTKPISEQDLDKISQIRMREVNRRMRKDGYDTVTDHIYTYNPQTGEFEIETFVEEHYDDHVRKLGKTYRGKSPEPLIFPKKELVLGINTIMDKNNSLYQYRNKDVEAIYVTYKNNAMKGKRTRAPSKCPIKLNFRGML